MRLLAKRTAQIQLVSPPVVDPDLIQNKVESLFLPGELADDPQEITPLKIVDPRKCLHFGLSNNFPSKKELLLSNIFPFFEILLIEIYTTFH